MAIKAKTKRKAAANKTPAKKADSPLDAFGFRKGTKLRVLALTRTASHPSCPVFQ
ncbi:MAG: hypothetical protein WD407_09165 [Rhodospirillales bacterium]